VLVMLMVLIMIVMFQTKPWSSILYAERCAIVFQHAEIYNRCPNSQLSATSIIRYGRVALNFHSAYNVLTEGMKLENLEGRGWVYLLDYETVSDQM
jgi:hypothetical protein